MNALPSVSNLNLLFKQSQTDCMELLGIQSGIITAGRNMRYQPTCVRSSLAADQNFSGGFICREIL